MTDPLVTIAVPSLNQGRYLDEALRSIFSQDVPVEVFVLDGGSTDGSPEIIRKWAPDLAWWRIGPDRGQAGAVNEGIARGRAPFVCWLNADDLFLPLGIAALVEALHRDGNAAAAYGRCWTINARGAKLFPYITTGFNRGLFSSFCTIAQPAALIRRSAWESIGGLNEELQMAMDYDLWWRLYKKTGSLKYIRRFVAATRMHGLTKTATRRRQHYQESMRVVRRHTGRVPLKWYAAWPLMVSLRGLSGSARKAKTGVRERA